jgi:hypothetical protein
LFIDTSDLANRPSEAANDAAPGDGAAAANEASSPPDDAAAHIALDASSLDCDAATFCDSFERATAQGSWSKLTLLLGATLAVDTTRGATGTSSMRVDLPALDAGSAEANLRQDIDRVPTGDLRVAFRVWTDAMPAREYHFLALSMQAQKRYIFFTLRPTGLFLVHQDSPAGFSRDVQIASSLATGWHEIDFTLHESNSVVVTFDGVAGAPFDLKYPLDTTILTLIAGVSFSARGEKTTVWLDDVRFVH